MENRENFNNKFGRRTITILVALLLIVGSFITMTMVITADTGKPQEWPPGNGVDYNNTIGTDWIVTTTQTWTGKNILVNGNMIVQNSATIRFISCTLKIIGNLNITGNAIFRLENTELRIAQPGITDGIFNIHVRNNGQFIAEDLDGNPWTDDDQSLITADNANYEFCIYVEATAGAFDLINSRLTECGYSSTYPGLDIWTNKVTLKDSLIDYCYNGTSFNGITGITIHGMRYEQNTYGIVIDNGASVTVDDCFFFSSGSYEIYVRNSRATIQDSTIDGNNDPNYCIYIRDPNGNATVRNCRIMDAIDYGIYMYNYANLTLENSIVYSCTDQGIYMDNYCQARIHYNDIFDNSDDGIWVNDWSIAWITNNNIYSNDDNGIFVQDECYAYIEDNRIWDNSWRGIYVNDESDFTRIYDNWIYSNDYDGINVSNSDKLEISGNTIDDNGGTTNNGYSGIYLQSGSLSNKVHNNTITNTRSYNIYVDGSNYNTIEFNYVYGIDLSFAPYSGIYLYNADYNTFRSNTIVYNYYGINSYNSDYNKFIDNNVDFNRYRGIYLTFSDYTELYYNSVTRSEGTNYGIYLESTSDLCKLINNSFSNRNNVYDNEATNIWDYNYYSDYKGYDNVGGDYIGDTADWDISGAGNNVDLNPRTKISTSLNSTTYARIDVTKMVIQSQRASPITINLPADTPNAGSRTLQQIGIWYEYGLDFNDYVNIDFVGDGKKLSYVDGYHSGHVFEFEDCDDVTFKGLSIDNGSGDGINWEHDDGQEIMIWDTNYELDPQLNIDDCKFESSGSDGIEINEYYNKGYQYLTDTGDADHGRPIFDNQGNLHVFWCDPEDSGGGRIWYMMMDRLGNILINQTPLTFYSDDNEVHRPFPLLDSRGHICLVWKDDRLTVEAIDTAHDLFFMRINPGLDDQNGDAADPDVIKVVDDTRINCWPTPQDNHVELQMAGMDIDSQNNIHLVWCEEDEEDWLYYNKLDSTTGNTLLGPIELIFYDGHRESNNRPDLACDRNDNLHLVWQDYHMTGGGDSDGEQEIFYAMLDKFGNKLIDRTMISPDDDYDSKRAKVMVDSQNNVHVVFDDNRLDDENEVFYTKLNPYLDDRNGDAAQENVITLVDDKYISGYGQYGDDYQSRHPYATIDAQNNIHVSWHEKDREWEVTYLKLDNNGNQLERFDLTPEDTFTDPTYQTDAWIAVDTNYKPHIVWTCDDGPGGDGDIAYYNPYFQYGSMNINIADTAFIDQSEEGIYIDDVYFGELNLNVQDCYFDDNNNGIYIEDIYAREYEMSTITIDNCEFIETGDAIYIYNFEGGDVTVDITNNYFEANSDAIYWDYYNYEAYDDWVDIPVCHGTLTIDNNYFTDNSYDLYIYYWYFFDYDVYLTNNYFELTDSESIYVDYLYDSAGTWHIEDNVWKNVNDAIYMDYPAYFDASGDDFYYTQDQFRPTYINIYNNHIENVENYGIYIYENYYAPLYINIDNVYITGTGDDFGSFYGIYVYESYYAPIYLDIKNSYIAHGEYGLYVYGDCEAPFYVTVENTDFVDNEYCVYLEYPGYYTYFLFEMTDCELYPKEDGVGIDIYYACDDDGAVFDMILDNVLISPYWDNSWDDEEPDAYDYAIYFEEFDYGRTYLTMTDCYFYGYEDGGIYAEDFYSEATLTAWIFDCYFESWPDEWDSSIYIDADEDTGSAEVFVISCDGEGNYHVYDENDYDDTGVHWKSHIYEGWWLDVQVFTGENLDQPAENVNIEVYDRFGNLVTGGLTDSTGWLIDLIVIEAMYGSGDSEYYNPFTVSASNGATSASTNVGIFDDTILTFYLSGDWDADGINDLVDPDDDNDNVTDEIDEFPNNPDEWQDTDKDGLGNNADPDDDNDGFPDAEDAFPTDPEEWYDTDGDGLGDNSDLDIDNDGWSNEIEEETGSDPYNGTDMPSDIDNDTIPDVLDPDIDGDGYLNENDDFPYNPAGWLDTDGDGKPDDLDVNADNPTGLVEDDDDDNDKEPDISDPFPKDPTEWSDLDDDGTGDNSDWDIDGDEWSNEVEVAAGSDPYDVGDTPSDIDQDGVADIYDEDIDGDGIPNTQDKFPLDPDEWKDSDDDGTGDGSDPDIDGDGVDNDEDEFPTDPDEWQDTDGDGTGDNADPDADGDGLPDDVDGDGIDNDEDTDIDGDGVDNDDDDFPNNPNEDTDTDGDGKGNNLDPDDDGDGYPDTNDDFPLDDNEYLDSDNDGIGDGSDPDIDGDGVLNEFDTFPSNPNEYLDTDGDGIGDNMDNDDDDDGVTDQKDDFPLKASETTDTDGDGIGNNADDDDDGDGIKDVDDEMPLVPNTTDEETVDELAETREAQNTLFYVMLGILILIIILLVVMMLMRGRGGAPSEKDRAMAESRPSYDEEEDEDVEEMSDDMVKCSECGSMVPADADECPSCGLSFEEDEGEDIDDMDEEDEDEDEEEELDLDEDEEDEDDEDKDAKIKKRILKK